LYGKQFDQVWFITTTTLQQAIDWYKSRDADCFPVWNSDHPEMVGLVRAHPLRNIIIVRSSESLISFLCRQTCDLSAIAYHMATSKLFMLDRAAQAYGTKCHIANMNTQWEHRAELLQWLQLGYHIAIPGLVQEMIRCCNIPDPYYLTHHQEYPMDMLDYLYMTECNDIVQQYEHKQLYHPLVRTETIRMWQLLPLSVKQSSHTFYTRAYDCHPK
jgi:hypothetical protein